MVHTEVCSFFKHIDLTYNLAFPLLVSFQSDRVRYEVSFQSDKVRYEIRTV